MIKEETKEKFIVATYDSSDPKRHWTHWAEGLTVIIQKGDTVISLNSEEIQKVVKALPRTFGGEY